MFYQGDLKGVVGLDMTLSDLLKEVTYFHEGDLSYIFVVDDKGRLLTHPLLPKPMAIEDDPIFLKMTTLETALKTSQVLRYIRFKIKSGRVFLLVLS